MTEMSKPTPPTDAEVLDALCIVAAYRAQTHDVYFPDEHKRAERAMEVIKRRAHDARERFP